MNDFEFQNHSAYREITTAFYQAMKLMEKEGLSPTEAVIKTAKDLGLNAQKTRRVAETANTVLTLNHFNKNPQKKGENFPIVNTPDTIKGLGLKLDKSAEDVVGLEQAKVEKEIEINDYFLNKELVGLGKQIVKGLPEVALTKRADVEENIQPKVKKLAKQAEDEFYKYTHSQFELDTSINKLTEIYSRIYPPDAFELMKYAQKKYRAMEPLVHAILKHLDDNATNFVVKTANKISKYDLQVDFIDNESKETFDNIIKYASNLIDQYKSLKKTCQEIDNLKKKDT